MGQLPRNVTTPGVHALNIWAREDGLYIDKIVLTTSSSYTPSGTGPAESVRGPVFVYDGDGNRVQAVEAGKITAYIGSHYEVEVSGGATTTRSYYHAGSQRLAMRLNADLYYLLGDHLGSTSLSYKAVGDVVQTQTYKAWGENRWPTTFALPTMLRYTGQRAETSLGIYFFNARWYDQWTGRFLQADTVVPGAGNPLDWDRYQYARANPLKYTDPDGHFPWLVLIGVLIYMATIPGDTGPYEVDPVTAAVGDAGLRMADPVDWAYTGIECLSGNCSGTDLLFGVLPLVNGGMDDAADAARALGSTDALAHADDVVETAGQFHHIFSSKISNALNEHRTLSGVLNRDNFIVQGLDAASHKGYQAWHRAYDQEVVNWLSDNPRATPEQFLSYMRDLYQRTEMDKRFPQAWKQLQMAIEEWE